MNEKDSPYAVVDPELIEETYGSIVLNYDLQSVVS